ncbi:dihydropteroate synthase [Jannaschia pagri]|uniref:Dihydropteroate synthase n=1 Tax=Jannaschia pagri TaxID=2829797 RepID=A0ABQ4NGI9_9RHOB|nr:MULTISPECIES: dihydropteroate synthase [unclassified Jannaschia]GIT90347.1 dihydropteroate synthase [Jannaschia sp. AI_61]GIT93547.1 dihydropteroate synthase [Jannaschia sp. AI_62]
MSTWHRPLPAPAAGPEAPRIAGGWLRFTHVERLVRGGAPEIVPVDRLQKDVLQRLSAPRPTMAGLTWSQPRIMGILNVTPDSFSDGGRHQGVAAAQAQAARMACADIWDVGGESTRPGATEVEIPAEVSRTAPVIAALSGKPISIDTRKAPVAEAALLAGATMVNDVSAGTFDPDILRVTAAHGAPICLMHAQGVPETMQDNPAYGDVLFDVLDALAARIEAARAAGIPRERIIVDPGIGFGKTQAHNLALLRRIGAFHDLGCPILLGASRKRFIGDIGSAPQADDRLPGTLAVTIAAVAQGVQLHRVHDVEEIAQGLALWRAVTGG